MGAARGQTVVEQLGIWARCVPRRVALEFRGLQISYQELESAVQRLSVGLLEAGVERGDRVAVLSTPRPEAWTLLLASASVGGVFVGVNPRYTRHEIRHVLQDSEPKVVFSLDSFQGRQYAEDVEWAAGGLGQAPPVVLFGDQHHLEAFGRDAAGSVAERLRMVRDSLCVDDPCLIVYTSGTTGKPKGALLAHGSLAFSSRRAADIWAGARAVCNLPMNHVGGLYDLGAVPFMAGARMIYMERFSPDAIIELIKGGSVNALCQVPTALQLIMDHPAWSDELLRGLAVVGFSGAPMPLPLIQRIRAHRIPMFSNYGSTETAVGVTECSTDASDDELAHTIGRPIEGVEYRIVDPEGADVGRGEEGELVVRHRWLFKGYWRDPEATRKAFTEDGFLRTTDLVLERPDGLLELRGRAQEVFKSGGYNVYPREIEAVLEGHPGVAQAAVVDIPDETYYRVGFASVVLLEGASVTPDELKAWCREHLANYKVPKVIQIRPELPMLPIGKVDRNALKQEVSGAEL